MDTYLRKSHKITIAPDQLDLDVVHLTVLQSNSIRLCQRAGGCQVRLAFLHTIRAMAHDA